MLQILGSPKNRLEAFGINCGLVTLMLALLLTVVSPASSGTRPTQFFDPGSLTATPEWLDDIAAIRPASESLAGRPPHRAAIERTGWQAFLPWSAPDLSSVALCRAADGPPPIHGHALRTWPVTPGTAPLMALVAYSPHAPPA